MKQFMMLVVGVSLFGLILPSTAMAAKADGKKAKLIAKYDKNNNGILDGDEMDALRKDYEADKEGGLKVYDTDADGKLSDDEIKAIKPGANKPKTEDGSKKGKKGKKGGKKNKESKSEDSAASKKTSGEGEPNRDKAAKSSE